MSTVSVWEQYDLTDLIRQILRSMTPDAVYHTGRPFLTTYQIAIELERRFPAVVANLNHALGGSGQGPYAITTYIARWLPDRIIESGRGRHRTALFGAEPFGDAGVQQSGCHDGCNNEPIGLQFDHVQIYWK